MCMGQNLGSKWELSHISDPRWKHKFLNYPKDCEATTIFFYQKDFLINKKDSCSRDFRDNIQPT